jgi:hypothetical protein
MMLNKKFKEFYKRNTSIPDMKMLRIPTITAYKDAKFNSSEQAEETHPRMDNLRKLKIQAL